MRDDRLNELCQAWQNGYREAKRSFVKHDPYPETFFDNAALWAIIGAACMAVIDGVLG